MTHSPPPLLRNGQAVSLSAVPVLGLESFRETIISNVKAKSRIASFFGVPLARLTTTSGDPIRLFVVLAADTRNELTVLATDVTTAYRALTPECPQAHWFEREIYEQWRVRPDEHPWLTPIRFHAPYRSGATAERPVIGVTDYFQVTGAEMHEVAVGPVHAGIIEPGHFRFQCHGENTHHLEISLGYQHRGVESALLGGPNKRTLHYMETLAGDTSVGHALAYASVLEALSGAEISPAAEAIRGMALELERLANHVGDLGALAGDVGFLPTQAYCGRIRGDFLNITALLCGNRFGRGLIVPGGVRFGVDLSRLERLCERVRQGEADTASAVNLLWRNASVMARFEDAGWISTENAIALGLVGPAARGSGVERDVRRDFAAGIYAEKRLPIAIAETGDVLARARVRAAEISHSIAFILEWAKNFKQDGPIRFEPRSIAPKRLAVSLTEGWRGEICHVALTDEEGRFAAYKIVDPSFHNWFGLALAMRDRPISDFPLCNKSFNLSYCGHDL